jgi:branched-chain amino acid transport system substrate-binding protein
MPTNDSVFGEGSIRPDGRVIHDLYVFQIKAPEQSKAPWDYYTLKAKIPASEAFRPMNQGGCSLV